MYMKEIQSIMIDKEFVKILMIVLNKITLNPIKI